ncbi:MarR family winged helix-turn-helix transcriptional regulator [Pseudomonas sp.]|uniref:MarR family winged helix-turn-helix transcriptional regulator n=1 Tax=Pseudomonas sp. TaxID=306 RepID=UPI003D1472F1
MEQLNGDFGEGDWPSGVLSLVLFVHLAIAGDADKGLNTTGLNRTHHRILFLVAHKPGVTVGEIVSRLRLSAQAIQAPLRALLDNGLLEQQSSERDRRKRHLVLTERGRSFLHAISHGQFDRITEARKRAGEDAFEGFLRFMRAMTSEEDREWLNPLGESAAPASFARRMTLAK